jgi:hypothetical protein
VYCIPLCVIITLDDSLFIIRGEWNSIKLPPLEEAPLRRSCICPPIHISEDSESSKFLRYRMYQFFTLMLFFPILVFFFKETEEGKGDDDEEEFVTFLLFVSLEEEIEFEVAGTRD